MKKPEGWKEESLGAVCDLLNGRAYSAPELLRNGKYPVLRVGNFFTNNHWYYSNLELVEDKYCHKEDLLYAWSASFGPRIWKQGTAIFHYHIWKIVWDSEIVDRDYLYYVLDRDKEKIKLELSAGGTMAHLTKASMLKRVLLLPPLPEQRRIAEVLSTWDRAIETAEKLLDNSEKRFKALMQQLLTGKKRLPNFKGK